MFKANLDYLLFACVALGGFSGLAWWMRKRHAQIPIVTWVVVGAVLILGWFLVDLAGKQERKRIENMVSGMAPTYAQELERMGHPKITAATAPDDPVYLAMIEAEKRWLDANKAVNDIYTLRRLDDGRMALIVDSETDYDHSGKIDAEREKRTAIGEPYEGALVPTIEKALSGKAAFMEEIYTDRWGTWVSALVPMFDSNGKVEAALGVDFDASAWLRSIAAARQMRILVFAVLLVLLTGPAAVISLQRADIAKRQRIEDDLRRSQTRVILRAQQSPLAVIEWDLESRVADWNQAAERLFGYTRAEAIGAALLEAIAPDSVCAEIRAMLAGSWEQKTGAPRGIENIATGDNRIVCEWINAPLIDGGRIIGVTSLCEDITERRQLEDQLRHAQKMEAIGQLAGGIAHDFNNLLCVIQGYTNLLREREDMPEGAIADLNQVAGSSERAADLTRQLLTFSRRQVFEPKKQNLNNIVSEVTKMLRHVLGEDISLATNFVPTLPDIHADTGMMEQVLMNLTVNARDAMPKGGRLVISTSSRFITEEEAAADISIAPGPVVCLEVADSGCGILPENLPRIFDPFFTTKEVGRGTGLGLATVYGIIEQHHGFITVESEPGRGTTFRIFLPAITAGNAQHNTPIEIEAPAGGHETILVVEDELTVRDFVTRLLTHSGYDVLSAASGTEALHVWEENRDRIDMLLTDMIMPDGFSGADLARRLRADDPDLKVIYTSGYSIDFVSRKLALLPGVNFIQKPYPPQELVRTVRENFDRGLPTVTR